MGVYQKQLERIDSTQVYQFQDGDMGYLPVGLVSPKEDFNPRKEFIEEEMEELTLDVKQRGVIQPIIVRKNNKEDGKFWIIAGERRWRSSIEAGLTIIPVIYREVSEVEAIALAKAENTERSDMGIIGEAYAAREALMACENDLEEAAAQMRMSVGTFNKRLMLLHAEPETQRALGRKLIKLGHAELLVGLPRDEQVATVEAIIEKGMNKVSISDLKRNIEGFVMELSEAFFDTTECNDCIHNTTKQAGLFDDNVGEGKCSNHTCFQEKTQAAVVLKKEDLSEKFNTVMIDIERTPESYTFIEKAMVGSDQYSACKGCDQFGALLSTKAGEEGQVTKGVCFNTECHGKKVKANQNSIKNTPSTNEAKKSATAQISAKDAKGSKSKSCSESTTPSNVTPKVVTEWIDDFLLQQAVQELECEDDKMIEARASHVCQALSIAQMLGNYSIKGKVDDKLLKQYKLDNANELNKRLALLIDLDESDLKILRNAAAIAYLKSERGTSAQNPEGMKASVQILAYFKVDISSHFSIAEAFLKGHTTAGIMSLLEEKSGMTESFSEWMNKTNEGSFKKLMQKTKGKIIDDVLESNFGFQSFVPRCISQRMSKLTGSK